MANPFEFSGGALCLDFSNTLSNRAQASGETLRELPDLLRWADEAGLLDDLSGRRYARKFAASRPEAERFLRRALALRERLYRLLSAVAAGAQPAEEDLQALNRDLATALRHLGVRRVAAGFEWQWIDDAEQADRLLWPVLRSAAELLTSDEIGQVRECGSESCSWLFVDRSRTHRRRWCDMKSCGNRAKARRHYRRKKKSGGGAT